MDNMNKLTVLISKPLCSFAKLHRLLLRERRRRRRKRRRRRRRRRRTTTTRRRMGVVELWGVAVAVGRCLWLVNWLRWCEG